MFLIADKDQRLVASWYRAFISFRSLVDLIFSGWSWLDHIRSNSSITFNVLLTRVTARRTKSRRATLSHFFSFGEGGCYTGYVYMATKLWIIVMSIFFSERGFTSRRVIVVNLRLLMWSISCGGFVSFCYGKHRDSFNPYRSVYWHFCVYFISVCNFCSWRTSGALIILDVLRLPR